MTRLVLYHFPRACSSVTMTALEEAGLEYEEQVINILQGEQRSPEYLKIHPGGKVPALQVDDRILTENAALLTYIDALKPEAGLLPKVHSPYERARVQADLIWIAGTVHPAVRQMRMPMRYTLSEDLDGIRAKGKQYAEVIMAQIEERVGDGNWWYGQDWSIVDVYLGWCCSVAAIAGFAFDAYPNLKRWKQRVQQRDSFVRARERQEAAEKSLGIQFPPA